jgi:hypothetical protein
LQICLLAKRIPIYYFNTTAIIRSAFKKAMPKSIFTGSNIAFGGKWGFDVEENCTKVHCYTGLNPVS